MITSCVCLLNANHILWKLQSRCSLKYAPNTHVHGAMHVRRWNKRQGGDFNKIRLLVQWSCTKMGERHHRYVWYDGSSKQSGGGQASISQRHLGGDVLTRICSEMKKKKVVYIYAARITMHNLMFLSRQKYDILQNKLTLMNNCIVREPN